MTEWERLCLDRNEQRQSLPGSRAGTAGKAKSYRTLLRQSRKALNGQLVLSVLLLCSACSQDIRRSGIPAGAQTVLDASLEDIDAGRYEKVYHEAADEWRNEATLDESKATFTKLREKLGSVRVRNVQSAREEQSSAGHTVLVVYQTSFERGEGMETVTLLERGGRWYLARYYVSSSALR